MDERASGDRVRELGAQLVDVHVHGALVRAHRRPPHRLVELLPADDPPFAACQGREQLQLLERERQRPPTRHPKGIRGGGVPPPPPPPPRGTRRAGSPAPPP